MIWLATVITLAVTVGPAVIFTWPARLDSTTRDVLKFGRTRDAYRRAVTPTGRRKP